MVHGLKFARMPCLWCDVGGISQAPSKTQVIERSIAHDDVGQSATVTDQGCQVVAKKNFSPLLVYNKIFTGVTIPLTRPKIVIMIMQSVCGSYLLVVCGYRRLTTTCQSSVEFYGILLQRR